MDKLIAHIEFLLTQHDCVILPGFGGFVLRYHEAMFTDEVCMQPPCKVVGFNSALIHNDGLLANSLMLENAISFTEAMILIEAQVKSLRTRLLQGEAVDMASLGMLGMGDEQEVIFTPAGMNHFDLDLFGFESLKLQPLAMHTKSAYILEEVPQKDVILVPVNVKLIRRITAVASIIIAMLCVSHPLEHGTIPQNYASMISSDLISKAIVPNFSYYSSQSEDLFSPTGDVGIEPECETGIVSSETESNEVVVEPAPEQVNVASAEIMDRPVFKPQKRYYIIVGSFPTADQAEKRIAFLSKKGTNGIQYLIKDNKYRLYINSFVDKTDANGYLDSLRGENPEFKDAWLLAHINR